MNPNIVIRPETVSDADAITGVTVAAFETLEISSHTEQFIVTALRAAGALTLSLVAEIGGRVVGHVAFSPVTISDGTPDWYGLGPVSVLPACQRQGIGKALIREGLSRLRALGARGCCLVGHPDYYRKFGFRLPERAGARDRGRAAGGFFRAAVRRAHAAGQRHLPRGVRGRWRGACGRSFKSQLTLPLFTLGRGHDAKRPGRAAARRRAGPVLAG